LRERAVPQVADGDSARGAAIEYARLDVLWPPVDG
jgi:hypothetical protein